MKTKTFSLKKKMKTTSLMVLRCNLTNKNIPKDKRKNLSIRIKTVRVIVIMRRKITAMMRKQRKIKI